METEHLLYIVIGIAALNLVLTLSMKAEDYQQQKGTGPAKGATGKTKG